MPIRTNQKNSVNSVNNKTGDIMLNASDVGALAQDADIITSINGRSGDVELTAADIGAASATDLAQTDRNLQDLADLVGDKANLPMPNETVVNNIEYVDTKVDGLMGDIGQLKGDIVDNIYSTRVKIEQGYYAIVDGNITSSNTWCRTNGYISKRYTVTSDTIKIFVLAFDESDEYIGTLYGDRFVKEYSLDMFVKSVDFVALNEAYPKYKFALDFYKSGETITPTDVNNDIDVVEFEKLKEDVKTTKNKLFEIRHMNDVYELGKISGVSNMYEAYPAGSPTNRARVKERFIQKIPLNAKTVNVKISSKSIVNGKYKVGWGLYTADFVQIFETVKGWYTSDIEFSQDIPSNAVYFMFYYASDSGKIILSELDNSKNSVVFNNSTVDYAKELTDIDHIHHIEDSLKRLETDDNYLARKMANIMSNVIFVNHRGFNTVAPENTIPAFELSAKEGFVYVETDVLFTSDDVPVLLHDGTINRTARNADGTELSSDIAIRDITYQQALTYDFGIWKSDKYKGTNIPTFDEFMAFCKSKGLKPFIELKDEVVYTESMVNSIIDIVKKYGMIDNVWFISFSYDNLLMVKNILPSAKLGLAGGYSATRDDESFMSVINQIIALRTDTNTVAMSGGYAYFNDTFYNLCISNDVPLIMWTVDTKEAYNSLYPCFFAILSNCLSAYDLIN